MNTTVSICTSSFVFVRSAFYIAQQVVAIRWDALTKMAQRQRLQQVTVFTAAYNTSTCNLSPTNRPVRFCARQPGGGKGDSGGP